MTAKDIMRPAVCVEEEEKLDKVMEIMRRENVTGVVVVDEKGELKGILTERDFLKVIVEPPHPSLALYGIFTVPEDVLRKAFGDVKVLKAKDIMTKKVITVDKEATLEEVGSLLLHNRINHLPVVEKGKVVGMIEREDLLRAYFK